MAVMWRVAGLALVDSAGILTARSGSGRWSGGVRVDLWSRMGFMGSKWKRNRQSPEQLYTRAKRELENGNAKEALKDAKVCYRAEANPEHRQLLEQAYVSRAQQLHNMRLMAEAGAVLDELAALVPDRAGSGQATGELRVLVGKGGAESEQLLADDPSLLLQMTDEAVLDPRRDAGDPPDAEAHRADPGGPIVRGAWGRRGGWAAAAGYPPQLASGGLEAAGTGAVGVLPARP